MISLADAKCLRTQVSATNLQPFTENKRTVLEQMILDYLKCGGNLENIGSNFSCSHAKHESGNFSKTVCVFSM